MSLNILFHGEKQVDDIHLGCISSGGINLYDIPPSTIYYQGKEYDVVERTTLTYDDVFGLGDDNMITLFWNQKWKNIPTDRINYNGIYTYGTNYASAYTHIKNLRYMNISPTIFDGKEHTLGYYPCWDLLKNITSLGNFVSQNYRGKYVNLNNVKLNFCKNWQNAFTGTNSNGYITLSTHPDIVRWDNSNSISGSYAQNHYFYDNADSTVSRIVNCIGNIGIKGRPSYIKYGRYANGAIYGDKATRDFSGTFESSGIQGFTDYGHRSINVIESNLLRTFSSCSNLISFYAPKYNISNGYNTFSSCSNLISVTLGGGNNTFYCDTSSMFFRCYNLQNVSIIGGMSNFLHAEAMFAYCDNLITLNSFFGESDHCTYHSYSMDSMFVDCTNLRNVGNFENIRTIPSYSKLSYLFDGCKNIALNKYLKFDSSIGHYYYGLYMFDSISPYCDMSYMFRSSSLGLVNAMPTNFAFFNFKNTYVNSFNYCFNGVSRGIRVEGINTKYCIRTFEFSNMELTNYFTLKCSDNCVGLFNSAKITMSGPVPSNIYLNNIMRASYAFRSVELLCRINNVFIGSNYPANVLSIAATRNNICKMFVDNNNQWYNTSNYNLNYKYNCTSTQDYETTVTYYGYNMKAYFYNNTTIYLNIYNKGNGVWTNRSIRIYNNQTASADLNLCFANARF